MAPMAAQATHKRNLLAIGLFAAAALLPVLALAQPPPQVRLVVTSIPSPTAYFPNDFLYTATLVNGSGSRVILTAGRYPGGYVGSGRYFIWFLDTWDEDHKIWRTIDGTKGPFARREKVTLGPGGQVDVGQVLLPGKKNNLGNSNRFRLRESDSSTAREWVSNPFMLEKR